MIYNKVVDETEVDRRAMQAILASTSNPPAHNWHPVPNWKFPEIMEDLTKYSGVTVELRPRVRGRRPSWRGRQGGSHERPAFPYYFFPFFSIVRAALHHNRFCLASTLRHGTCK